MYRYLQKCLYRGLCPKLSTNRIVVFVMLWVDVALEGLKLRLRECGRV